MSCRVVLSVLWIWYLASDICSSFVMAGEPRIDTPTECERSSDAASSADRDSKVRMHMELMPRLRRRNENVMQELEAESDLDLVGHPASYAALVLYINSAYSSDGIVAGWNIEAVVDEPALSRHGIRLHEAGPSELRAGGVSRRSSLRFVLDVAGLSYYVDGKRLVVTTKDIARVKWLAQLKKPDPESLRAPSVKERRETAFAAGFSHLDPVTWAGPLATALSDSDREVCFDAAFALGEFGPQAERAVDPLIKVLRGHDLTLREGAVCALAKIGPKAAKELLELIDGPDRSIAVAAAKSLGLVGSAAKESVVSLIEVGKRHADDEARCSGISSAVAAVDLGDAVPTLRELLKSDKAGIRAFAAETIGHMSRAFAPKDACEMPSPAANCAQDLLPLLSDSSTRVRRNAASALAQLALSTDLPSDFPTAALEAAAKDPDYHVSSSAAAALHLIKSEGPQPGKDVREPF